MRIPKTDLNSYLSWPLRSLFPELTDSQFRAAALYTLGASNQEAARICGVTESAIKRHQALSREALDLDTLASLRMLFNCRMLAGLYALVAETPAKDHSPPFSAR